MLECHLQWTRELRREGQPKQGDLQKRRSYRASSGAELGELASRLAAVLVAMHGVMGKPDSCSYCEFGRGPGPLTYKNPSSPPLGSSSSSSLRLEKVYIHFFHLRYLYFLLRSADPTVTIDVLSYQPHSGKYSHFQCRLFQAPCPLRGDPFSRMSLRGRSSTPCPLKHRPPEIRSRPIIVQWNVRMKRS